MFSPGQTAREARCSLRAQSRDFLGGVTQQIVQNLVGVLLPGLGLSVAVHGSLRTSRATPASSLSSISDDDVRQRVLAQELVLVLHDVVRGKHCRRSHSRPQERFHGFVLSTDRRTRARARH